MSEGVELKRVCGLCGKQKEGLLMCGACKSAWYCSRDHQKQHWKHHKVNCRRKNGTSQPKEISKQTNFSMDPSVLDEMNQSISDNIHFQTNGDGARTPHRRSQYDPDLSTPIDPARQHGDAMSPPIRPRTPSMQHVEFCPDIQWLEKLGFNDDWFSKVTKDVISHLNEYGLCVIDNFLGEARADTILGEVSSLHHQGQFRDGQVVSRQEEARGRVRGDKITWVTGTEAHCTNIGTLVSVVDSIIGRCNKHPEAGKLASYNIKWRTRAMVACYPGNGTHYVKHVDNPNGDGRCITAIYYINKGWQQEDGGVLRILPEGMNKQAEIEPLFDRMLFFWSDRRNPHEVLPANIMRYAITVWYLDQREREDYLARMATAGNAS